MVAGTSVFVTAHIADELYSRWDMGATVSSPLAVAFAPVVVVALALLVMVGIVSGRLWGYWLGVAFGLVTLWPPLSHVLNTSGMDTFRWSVVALNIVFAVGLVVASARELVLLRPTSKARSVGG